MIEMQKVRDVINPTPFDSSSNFVSHVDREEYFDLLVVLTRNRDSGVLEGSNWRSALNLLGGESETVEIHRFGHWACGWYELLCVAAGSKAHTIAARILEGLEDYPVVDEEDHSCLEHERALEVWSLCYDKQDRVDYIRKHQSDFSFLDYGELLSVVRGESFTGYACNLID